MWSGKAFVRSDDLVVHFTSSVAVRPGYLIRTDDVVAHTFIAPTHIQQGQHTHIHMHTYTAIMV